MIDKLREELLIESIDSNIQLITKSIKEAAMNGAERINSANNSNNCLSEAKEFCSNITKLIDRANLLRIMKFESVCALSMIDFAEKIEESMMAQNDKIICVERISFNASEKCTFYKANAVSLVGIGIDCLIAVRIGKESICETYKFFSTKDEISKIAERKSIDCGFVVEREFFSTTDINSVTMRDKELSFINSSVIQEEEVRVGGTEFRLYKLSVKKDELDEVDTL